MQVTQSAQQIVPIFSGGGTRLSAHIGIIHALHDLNIEFKQVVGVSGGSIIAAMYCAGYSIEEMETLAANTDFNQFREGSWWRLLTEGGMSSGDVFQNWLEQYLKGMTFAQCKVPLNILATDVNGGGPVIFNKQNTPDMHVAEAVRYSMSIPLVFSFKQYKDHILVDGAILAEDALFQNWDGNGTPSVCFRLQGKKYTKEDTQRKLFKLPTYIGLLVRTFMDALSREYVHQEYWNRTIVVDTGDISAVDFNLSTDKKHHLYELGYSTVKSFLPRKLNDYHQSVNIN